MASKKDVLSQLSRAELIAFVSEAGLEVADRRVREQLIAALSASKRARPSAFLSSFSADRLKQIAANVGSEGGGRNKAAIIEAITSGTKRAGARATKSAPKADASTQKRRTSTAASAAPLRVTKTARKTTKTKPRTA